MKKYVIGHEEHCLFICKTRADAEEILLSIAEENIYENWLINNCSIFWGNNRPYYSPFEYISKNGEDSDISNWAWALYSFSSTFWIEEVIELE